MKSFGISVDVNIIHTTEGINRITLVPNNSFANANIKSCIYFIDAIDESEMTIIYYFIKHFNIELFVYEIIMV